MLMAKSATEIYTDINEAFYKATGKDYRAGSALGFFTDAVSRSLEAAHNEIDNNKNPHIYTNLSGTDLDKFGTMVNIPRESFENDNTYLYRLLNWTYLKAGANKTSINDSLLNLTYSSNAEYYPGVYGAGTGIVYIIPKEYETDTMQKALEEAKERIADVISPESYTEYIIPTPIAVKIVCYLTSKYGDIAYLKSQAESVIKEYVNGIAPNDYLSIGEINKMIINMNSVDMFSVDGIYLDDTRNYSNKIMQDIETKLLFDSIVWEDGE